MTIHAAQDLSCATRRGFDARARPLLDRGAVEQATPSESVA
ncbi:hypothetical protein [Nocardia jinanensis]|nr:hypothetical protein [Nocardia jinanensis]